MRWSSAESTPSFIRRRRVGWPTSRQANGLDESRSWFVRRRMASNWSWLRRWDFHDHDGGAAALGVFGGERVGGLGGQGRVMGEGLATQRGDDAVVDTAHPDGGIGQVDDGVAAAIQAGEGGAHGDGLARPA